MRPVSPLPRWRRNFEEQLVNGATFSGRSYLSDSRLPTKPHKKKTSIELDGYFFNFDNIFLRDACSCPQCVDPSTQQKLIQTTDIPYDISTKTQARLDGGTKIVWENDLHESYYPAEFLRRYATKRSSVRANHNDQMPILWDKKKIEKEVTWVEYNEYMSSDKALFQALKQLLSYGLIFMRDIPSESSSVQLIAERIGNLKNTFYGKTWDVKSINNSKNIAYTSLDLGLHMDLLYFESPPGLQFLHCLQNSTKGGSSIFVDSFRAATVVRQNSALLFQALTSFPVTFHYVNDGHHYHFTRPTVVLEENSYHENKRISHVNWAPPFQAPFEMDHGANNGKFRAYITAAKEFAGAMENPDSQLELRLEPGQCVIFGNRRIVHSRRAFDPATGDRWLKGAYVDLDTFLSKLRVLSERYRQGDQHSYIH
ncbi:hypothetical protein EDC01DRAFT_614363 [Geopyxis carbonaria]|nr:hypothetical protein EDC01DRAFT_614363 [Geopyxis carbonaria]